MASKEVKKLQVAAEALGYRVYRVTSKNRTIYASLLSVAFDGAAVGGAARC